MAKEPRQTKTAHQLRQEIAHSRDRLARDLSGLKYELDFPLKFRKSFQRKTGIWVSAVTVAGILFSLMPARRKKVVVNPKLSGKSKGEHQKEGILGAGLAIGALKFAATLARPAVMSYFTKKMGGGDSIGRTPRR